MKTNEPVPRMKEVIRLAKAGFKKCLLFGMLMLRNQTLLQNRLIIYWLFTEAMETPFIMSSVKFIRAISYQIAFIYGANVLS